MKLWANRRMSSCWLLAYRPMVRPIPCFDACLLALHVQFIVHNIAKWIEQTPLLRFISTKHEIALNQRQDEDVRAVFAENASEVSLPPGQKDRIVGVSNLALTNEAVSEYAGSSLKVPPGSAYLSNMAVDISLRRCVTQA
jgi:hypothetical protein